MTQHSYLLQGDSNQEKDAEVERLLRQAEVFHNRPTRHLLMDAGIAPGMSVLDIGSGVGDVALLAAELVGPSGRVVGVELEDRFVQVARERAATLGYKQAFFLQGDVTEFQPEETFDALVGRSILSHLPNPQEALRRFLPCVRSGGVVALREIDNTSTFMSYPPSPTAEELKRRKELGIARLREIGRLPGGYLGSLLRGIFEAEGLLDVQVSLDIVLGGNAGWPGWAYLERQIGVYKQIAERTGIDGPGVFADVDAAEWAARIRHEVVTAGGVIRIPEGISTWGRKP